MASDATASDATLAVDSTESTAATEVVELDPATFTVQPGTEQVTVLGAEPGTELALIDGEPGGDTAGGTVVASDVVDEQGSLLFRAVVPGEYRLTLATEASDVFVVADRTDVPPASLYEDQELLPTDGGFGYIITRDSTTLSANVVLPGPAAEGPYPTVVEYSGYRPSDPDSADLAALYTAQGFAYVGVNMRGTGCSGGSFRFFETVQSLDGYDVVEAVAAQPWVKNHEVGMVGHLLPGHQPVVRRRHPAAQSERHHPVVGDRRQLPQHAVSGRHPEHRLRRQLDAGAHWTRPSPTARTGRRPAATRATRCVPTTRCSACRTPTSCRRSTTTRTTRTRSATRWPR